MYVSSARKDINNMKVSLLVLCFILQCFSYRLALANEVLGCGGYIRSDVEISFAQVGIKLLTKQGNVKYDTECAPNNGYYFVPIYDKGDYVIKVSPPPGWSFEPSEVEVHVDGENDPCSKGKNFDFHFKGFAVIGKVISIGSDSGPEGVQLNLFRGETLIKSTHSDAGGSYVFTPLSSGTYTVVASHPTWKLIHDEVTVEVADENGDAGSSLVVGGYTVSGRVLTDGEATQGVNVVLHAVQPDAQVEGCNVGVPEAYKSTIDLPAICYVTSDAKGSFVFSSSAPGEYTLVPFFQSKSTKYEVLPASLVISVGHQDLRIPEPFKVEGFSVTGFIVKPGGAGPIEGATVVLDGSTKTTTNGEGQYVFDNVKSGTRLISVYTDTFEFDGKKVQISSQNPVIAEIVPQRFKVCISISVDKATSKTGPWTIDIKNEGGAHMGLKIAAAGEGCLFLPQGSYVANVKLSNEDDTAGIRFGPSEHTFQVVSDPIMDILFSQFLGEVRGEVKCLEQCPQLSITLRHTRGSTGGYRSTTVTDSKFAFTEVVPGTYQLTIHKEEWCWKQKSTTVTINTQNVEVLLEHTGYQLTVASSHETTLSYTTNTGTSGTLKAQRGTTLACLSNPGLYTLVPLGCHKFGDSPVTWDTKAPNLVTLAATHHQLTGAIRAMETASFIVQVETGSHRTTLGPLNPSPEDPTLYIFEHWVREGESVSLTPSSPTNLYQYQPASHVLTMPSDCVMDAITFTAERALFIYGEVLPALAGVTITVEGGGQIYTFITESDGKYTAGPLDNSKEYSISAEKKGYIMNELPERGHFEAYKLAEIVVEVKNEAGEPLPGVLVSMSGGTNYHKNILTESDGTIAFLSLTPGDYFLRPMMKEYRFDPPSRMVTVEEGSTIEVSISGVRVAYSVYGHTVSLSGEAEGEVLVEAIGVGEGCAQYQEEATSDAQGSFRIRGLTPKCDYVLQLKRGNGINQPFERTLPSREIIHTNNEDIKDLKLIILRPFNQMDVTGKVETDSQYLSTLSARLYRDDIPDSPVHTLKLGQHPFFLLPQMIADLRSYTLRLESSLPTSQYSYSVPEVSFVADSPFKHLSVKFDPELRSVDAEMNQSTVFGLVLIVLILIITFNFDKINPMMEMTIEFFSSLTSQRTTSSISSDSTTQELVSKRKVKARKT